MFRALLVSVATAGMLVGSAVDARAGLLDYIWDTSGPPYLGWVFRCRRELKRGGNEHCDKIFGRIPDKDPITAPVWLSLESGAYLQLFKDGKDSDGEPIPFGIGHGVAFSFEPIVEFRPWRRWRSVHHGVGLAALVMASTDFERVGNVGYKVRVFAIDRFWWDRRWSIALNARIFPDGFGDDEFGVGAPPVGDRPTELSLGASFSF
jgi:hypothetical protein